METPTDTKIRSRSRPSSARDKSRPKTESMSSWLERQASSHHFQLAATAVISGAAVAGLIYGGQAIRRKAAVDELKASIPELDESHHSEMVSGISFNKRSSELERLGAGLKC